MGIYDPVIANVVLIEDAQDQLFPGKYPPRLTVEFLQQQKLTYGKGKLLPVIVGTVCLFFQHQSLSHIFPVILGRAPQDGLHTL